MHIYSSSSFSTTNTNTQVSASKGQAKLKPKAEDEQQRAFWRRVVSNLHQIKSNFEVEVIAQKYKRLDKITQEDRATANTLAMRKGRKGCTARRKHQEVVRRAEVGQEDALPIVYTSDHCFEAS